MNEGHAWPLYQRRGGLYRSNSVHALNLAEQTEIARVRQPHEAAGKIRAINRGIEEESQRRYYTVHRRHQGVLALLPYLEAAQIIHGVGMIVLSACYLFGGLVVAPDLWLDPLGPMVKVVPAIVLAAIVAMMLEAR